jgi:hypothetical protein
MNHGRDKGMFSGQFTVPGKWQVRQEIKKKNPEGTRYCRLAREPQNSKGKYELLQFGDNVKHNR